jgi:predicted nucleic acid-binding protein
MTAVLDVSAAMQILQRTSRGVAFINALMNCDKVVAPTLYIAELSNAIWKSARKIKGSFDLYRQMAEDGVDFVDEYADEGAMWAEALRAAHEHDHPAYDLFYAILAHRHDAVLLTCDEKLLALCHILGVRTKSGAPPDTGA